MQLHTKLIERKRKKLGYSVKVIADKMNITRQAYYDIIESASTKLSTITTLGKVLKCNPKDLLL